MKAIFYRVMLSDGTPSGHVGYVTYTNKADMFWCIDEYVDPYRVEIKHAQSFSFWGKVTKSAEGQDLITDQEFQELPCPFDDRGWIKPKFPAPENLF